MRRLLIAVIALATSGFADLATAEDIALSLVHPKGRVDIPVSALKDVRAYATLAVRNTETGEIHEYPEPSVEVCYNKDIKARICQLTQQIVGEPMALLVDCEIVLKPVVREPLCSHACLSISASDLDEANALMQRIRHGTNRVCSPSS